MASACEDGSGSGVGKRGPTSMSRLTWRAFRKGKFKLQWNPKGQPIGEYRDQFASYVALRARVRAPISLASWKKVSQEIRDLIWDDITEVFDIPPDKKKWVIGRAGERWSDFKSRLTKTFLRSDDGSIRREPPSEYDYISQEDWDAFVESRLSEEFQERSIVNRACALKNDCTYRAGRKGYVGLEQEMLSERSLDPTKSTIPREELWKRGRVDKDGNITNEFVQEVADKIDSLSKGSVSEDLTEIEDILTWALGKKDHAGRVRGVGPGVTITGYFGRKKSAPRADSSNLKILEELQKQVKEMQRKIEVLESKNCKAPTQSEEEVQALNLHQNEEFIQPEDVVKPASLNPQSEDAAKPASLNHTQLENEVEPASFSPTQSEDEVEPVSFNPTQFEEEAHPSSLNEDEEPIQFEQVVQTSGPKKRKEPDQLEEVHVLSVKHGKEPARPGKEVRVSCHDYGTEPTQVEKEVQVRCTQNGKKPTRVRKKVHIPTYVHIEEPVRQEEEEVRLSARKRPKKPTLFDKVQVPRLKQLKEPAELEMMVHLSSAKNRKEPAQREREDQVPNARPGICLQELLAGPVKCQLMLDKPLRTVALGRVFLNQDNLPAMLHCGTLGHNHKKVIIDTPLEPDAPLPVPVEEASIVDDAEGSFVAWPLELIALDVMALQTPPCQGKKIKIRHASATEPMPLRPQCSTPTSTEKHAAESLSKLRAPQPQLNVNKRSARHRRGYTQRRGYL